MSNIQSITFFQAASHFGVTQNIKFGQNVVRAEWIEQQGKWEITTENGEKLVANILIDGTGTLHVPNTPDFLDNVRRQITKNEFSRGLEIL